jgi:LacI family transcriptional regulator
MADLPTSPTQDAIAIKASVSRSTVSRALKNHPSIPEATRKRILQIAEEMGYRENPFVTANMQRVRGSRARRSQAIIAFLTPFALERWFAPVQSYRKIYESAKARAHELGFELDPISLVDQELDSHRCNDILIARGIDGVLVAPFENPFMRLRLDWNRFSVATLGFAHVQPRFSYAAANHYYNMCLAFRRLQRMGYRRIGLALPERANRYAQGTFEAAYRLYSGNQPPACRIPHFAPEKLGDWNADKFCKWLKKCQPEAVVHLTSDVPTWLTDAGFDIPNDIGLATLSRHGTKEGVSGVDQHSELVGAAGVQIIAEQLTLNQRGIPAYPKAIFIEGEWATGWTTRSGRPSA